MLACLVTGQVFVRIPVVYNNDVDDDHDQFADENFDKCSIENLF